MLYSPPNIHYLVRRSHAVDLTKVCMVLDVLPQTGKHAIPTYFLKMVLMWGWRIIAHFTILNKIYTAWCRVAILTVLDLLKA